METVFFALLAAAIFDLFTSGAVRERLYASHYPNEADNLTFLYSAAVYLVGLFIGLIW